MSTYSLLNNKIPHHILEIINAFQKILGEQAYDFLLIGASARDLILDGIHDMGSGRLTNDVDFALYVPEWKDYQTVCEKLISSGLFSATKITHKLMFKQAYEIDIVPFGAIQNEQGNYTWPPDHIKAMNVAGFIEVNTAGIEVGHEGTIFRVASLPGICIMKLLAWKDRGITDNRDGRDLGFILTNYIDLKADDLYTLHEDLMHDENFDRFATTARIMGREIYDLLKGNPHALNQLKEILTKETEDDEYSRLAFAIKDGAPVVYKLAYKALQSLLKGISEQRDNDGALI
jgi:predicted nucleotidyltransferase